ncbi:MAG: diguanylate cyclase/phosphodiesterase with and sensor(s) [Moraxellaceae bacterium]|jgi:diguanylate cyclase (GGDEF)-like protein|nr:diguanylate cyclase/phosphodiesterase with and sensor(s) [Moraxellaceae bacterium]
MRSPPDHSSHAPADTTFASRTEFPAAIPELRALLGGGMFTLLRMPDRLEAAFRVHRRRQAADMLRRSIYGLMLMFLIAVVPVSLLAPEQPFRADWLWTAVFPLGLALTLVWAATSQQHLVRYVEPLLGAAIVIGLAGTTYAALALGKGYYGTVAAFETIYLMVAAFTLLRLSVRLVAACAAGAFVLAAGAAAIKGVTIDWLQAFMYFGIPLAISAISGSVMGYTVRRDFLQTLCHRQEKFQLLHDMAAVSNETSDVHSMLELSLGRICTNMGWVAGHAILVKPQSGERTAVRYVNREADPHWQQYLETEPLPTMASSMFQDVLRTGEPVWNIQTVHLQDMLSDTQISGLAFPVIAEDELVAVLEFMSARHESPDEHLLTLMEQVCTQIARVFERRRQQEDLRKRALYDTLTGLPNRNYLFDQLRGAMSRAQRNPDYHFCVLFMDLDRFKWVNDSLGHVKGDRMLIEFSARLQQEFRPNDMVARLGGDEFAVLVDDIRNEDDAKLAAVRVQQRMLKPMVLDGQEVNAGVSIGIVLGAPHYKEPEEILRDADTAMYMAKHSGRGTHVVFAQHMREEVVDRLRMVAELRRAIEGNQLQLHYQPIVSLESGMVSGFEALVRWPHPTRGMISPVQFIPLAEETGLILPLTRWVMNEACRQLGIWQKKGQAEGVQLSVSVNLGARYFAEPAMPDEVRALISKHHVTPGSLRLEITETQIIENAELCMQNIQRLDEDEVRVYIDDFGTGYSSLNYLANFKVNALKIDRSFMYGLEIGGKEAIVVRAIASLSRHLGLDVIAEGVETQVQLSALRDIGCHYVQGFLLSRPVEASKAEALIGQRMLVAQDENLVLA